MYFYLQVADDSQSECDADLLIIAELGIHEKVVRPHQIIFTSRARARGKVIGLCVCCHCHHQHEMARSEYIGIDMSDL